MIKQKQTHWIWTRQTKKRKKHKNEPTHLYVYQECHKNTESHDISTGALEQTYADPVCMLLRSLSSYEILLC